MDKIEKILRFLPSQNNSTIVPIEDPTTTIPTPYGGGETVTLIGNPLILLFIVGIIIAIFVLWRTKKWAFKQERRQLDEVNPSLNDLDSSVFSLSTYLAIQGGMAIIVSVVCTLSIIFVLINPMITILTCASTIGLSGYAREKAMNVHRANYKNRQNLEGYMRTKMGNKRRYSWANINFLNPYTPDEKMYMSLSAEVAKINAEKIEGDSVAKNKIMSLHTKVEKEKNKLAKINKKILRGKIILPPPEPEEPKSDDKGRLAKIGEIGKKLKPDKMVDRFVPFSEEEIEEMRKPVVREIERLEAEMVLLGEQIPKEIDLDKLVPNPIMVNEKYLVIVIAKDIIKNRIDFVDWYDYDIFGEFKVPTAGPELREVSTFHRVKVDPQEESFRMDEYIPVFASLFDDGHSREALVPIEAIDLETNDLIAAMSKAIGVERKHTAGEINTSKALSGDLLNEDRDFELLVEVRSDSKAQKIIEAEKKLKSLNAMVDWITPPVVIMVTIFVLGTILGFLLGQNSILLG
jgi:hypothetical protein